MSINGIIKKHSKGGVVIKMLDVLGLKYCHLQIN